MLCVTLCRSQALDLAFHLPCRGCRRRASALFGDSLKKQIGKRGLRAHAALDVAELGPCEPRCEGGVKSFLPFSVSLVLCGGACFLFVPLSGQITLGVVCEVLEPDAAVG